MNKKRAPFNINNFFLFIEKNFFVLFVTKAAENFILFQKSRSLSSYGYMYDTYYYVLGNIAWERKKKNAQQMNVENTKTTTTNK